MKLRSNRTIQGPAANGVTGECSSSKPTDRSVDSLLPGVTNENSSSKPTDHPVNNLLAGVTGESNSTKPTDPPVEMTALNDPLLDISIHDYALESDTEDIKHSDYEPTIFDLNELPLGGITGLEGNGGDILLSGLEDDYGDLNHGEVSRKRRKSGIIMLEDPTDDPDFLDNYDHMFDEAEVDPVPPIDLAPPIPPVDLQGSRKKRRNQRRKGKPVLLWEVWEEENEKWVDQHLKEDANLDQLNQAMNETVEEPKDLILPLLRYQKEWLAWALKQEESSVKGGILADEMGMGKTLQAIALVLTKRQLQRETCVVDEPPSPSPSTQMPHIGCTLVICPVVAVTQWVDEIARFTAKGSTRVLVYHGANRGKCVQQFSGFDFVITTYSTVEADYRRYVMPPKKKCKWCGKAYTERKIAHHEKYFCGPGAVRTEKQSKQDRKKKKPSPTISEKKEEIADDCLTEPEDDKQPGPSRRPYKKHKEQRKGQDTPNENKGQSILHSVTWERVILDEAHYIKDKRCNTAKAILALESSYKWALSGTPLQNRVGELYSLIRFLQIVPYSFYMCKDCDCRILDYSVGSDCTNCPHKCVRHFCWWNRYVATPIQESGSSESGRGAMLLLKHKVLKTILLRRTKKDRASDLALPPRIITLRRDNLDVKEEDYYTSLYNDSQAQFNTYVQRGTVMNNYAHIFDLLTRLRQAVDHPYLVVYSSTNMAKSENMVENDQSEQACGLCHETVEDPVVTSCTHAFCKACLIDYSSSFGQVACPTCSKPLTVDFSSSSSNGTVATVKGFRRSSILNRVQLNDFQTSTKIDALREEIRFMIERDGSAKGIVFSQFTSFLDLISYSLQKSGITCVQLVGSMTLGARDNAIKRFNEDPDCRIFLMSLKAGGVALNLTVASHVFLMDPWWNPAVERQAQDRIHRIGQYKPIRIVRFVIANTVEERILQLQEKKELVFEGTVGGSSDALGKLTESDLRFLFIT